MSPSSEIRRRIKNAAGKWVWSDRAAPGKKGDVRWCVYFRTGGRGSKQYGGSFRRKGDAEARTRLIDRELAAGRDPVDAFTPSLPDALPFRASAERWAETRINLAGSTRATYAHGMEHALDFFGDRDINALTLLDAESFVAYLAERVSPASVRTYFKVPRMVVDHALDPEHNVFRDKRVQMPRLESVTLNPPTWDHVAAVLEQITSREIRLALILMERTGMRVGETCSLTWADLDIGRAIVRLQGASTKAHKPRLVPVDPELMAALDAFAPREDRELEASIVNRSPHTVEQAVRRGVKWAGVPAWTPHDLRHRRISLRIGRGDNPINVAAEVGHSDPGITWKTYSHVLMDMTDPPTAEVVARWLGEGVRR